MFDLLITGGTVVMPTEAAAVDVGVQDGRIVAIGAPGTLIDEAAQTVGHNWARTALLGKASSVALYSRMAAT